MSNRHRFRCRSCGASAIVDDHIQKSILASGCPICLAEATEDAFEVVAHNA